MTKGEEDKKKMMEIEVSQKLDSSSVSLVVETENDEEDSDSQENSASLVAETDEENDSDEEVFNGWFSMAETEKEDSDSKEGEVEIAVSSMTNTVNEGDASGASSNKNVSGASSYKGNEKKRTPYDERTVKRIEKKLKKEQKLVEDAKCKAEFVKGFKDESDDEDDDAVFKRPGGTSHAKKRRVRATKNAAKRLIG